MGAPDRLFASLDDREAERQVAAWQRLFAVGGAAEAALAHLHHLTPQHDALARVAPNLPVVAHLHGTELKMLDGIRRRRELAVRLGTDLTGMAAGAAGGPPKGPLAGAERELFQSTRWASWRHGDAWEARLQANARRANQLIAISTHDRDEAVRLLGVSASRVEVISNGVDVELFERHSVGPEERLARWRAWLVGDPRGWDASGVAGSVRYGETTWRYSPIRRRARLTRCCCTSGASSHSSGCRSSCAPTSWHGRASKGRRRSSSGAGTRASGRESTLSRWRARAGARGSSSPAGGDTTTCPTG